MIGREWKWTIRSFCLGLFIMAVVVNIVAILLIPLRDLFNLSFEQAARLTLINFLTQMAVDLIAGALSSKIKARVLLVIGTICAFIGFILFALLPSVMPSPYLGLMIAIILLAIGSGVYEMLISPLMNAIPSDTKTEDMAFLHSFYAWGSAFFIVSSTIIFFITGAINIGIDVENLADTFYNGVKYWKILPIVWAVPTLILIFAFAKIKLPEWVEEEKRQRLRDIVRKPYMILMLAAIFVGAMVENVAALWISAFSDRGLGIDKFIGDLAGVSMLFVAMAITRSWFGKYGEKVNMSIYLMWCTVLSAVLFVIAAVSPNPVISLAALVLVGFSASMMWPGALSMSASYFPLAGATMFAVMACAGDSGAGIGPWLTGIFADNAGFTGITGQIFEFFGNTNLQEDAFKVRHAMLTSTIFPISLLLIYLVAYKVKKRS